MKKFIALSFIWIAACCKPAFSQQYLLQGRVLNKETRKPLPGVSVNVKGTSITGITQSDGTFSLSIHEDDKVTLIVSAVGFQTTEVSFTNEENGLLKDILLSRDYLALNEVVVSVSKRPETITNAPASVQMINAENLEQFAGSNVNELFSKVQGIEFTRSGVDGITLNARGLNSAFNNKIVQWVDGRNSMSPLSGGLPVISSNTGTYIKEDIERIEVIMGPQAALYGPNANNVVFNFIGKDPRKYQGTTASISGGNQSRFSARLRHAAQINNKWAYKFNGEYSTGKEFNFYDSVKAGGGVYEPAVNIPERNVDFNFRHIRGEAHIYYTINPKADLIVSTGGSKNDFLQVTTGARNQMKDIVYGFVQAKLVHPRYFATVYNTWGDIGSSFVLSGYTRDYWNRTHSTTTTGPNRNLPPDSAEIFARRTTFKEKSQRLNAEFQYNYHFQKQGLFLIAGVNYQRERPNGYGINLIDSFNRITITQYGAVVQLEKSLPLQMRFIAALRSDHHSNFGNYYSPKIALIKNIRKGSIRINWARAYAMPSIQQQYAGIQRFLFGNSGDGIYYIPNGANINDQSSYKTTTTLTPERVSTWELGYKGSITNKLYLDINYYTGKSKNFIGPSLTVGGRVLTVNGEAITHNPAFAGATDENGILRDASFLTFFNYGSVRVHGVDAGLNYLFNKHIRAAVRYSYIASDITKDDLKNDANRDGFVSLEEKSLNAPKNRAVFMLGLQDLCKEKMYIHLSARYVQEYDFYSGSQIGTAAGKGNWGKVMGPNGVVYAKNFDWGSLGGFTSMDINAGYRFSKSVSANISISNLFNTRQIEFVASPSIGRLILAEISVHIPEGKKK